MFLMMRPILVLFAVEGIAGMRSNQSKEELQPEHFIPGLDEIKDAVGKADVVNQAKAVVRGLSGGACPDSFKGIPDGWSYGIGCAFVEKHLAGEKGEGCHCPSFLDVCATAPRFQKVRDMDSLRAQLSVSQLGYCRTGAWVFIVSTIFVLGLVAAIVFLVIKRRGS
ncbi:unnamed protein product [Durusdinium trenchii]|uniref:Uncharacterized protein n=1 Tax=Durusdinium trenchii TaxID=1381693 RepID=A0ABP0QVT1_9DINO